jgi:hypothetical protein
VSKATITCVSSLTRRAAGNVKGNPQRQQGNQHLRRLAHASGFPVLSEVTRSVSKATTTYVS